jgi:hypothetical protein
VRASAVLVQHTASIIIRNFSLIVLELAVWLLSGIALIVTFAACLRVLEKRLPLLLCVYFAFTFFWTINTLCYVAFMMGAGVTAHDFYTGRQRPVLNRVLQIFGIASFCGCLMAGIRALRLLIGAKKAESHCNSRDDGKKAKIMRAVLCVVLAIVDWLLGQVERVIGELTGQSILYCGMLGCSLKEGFVRFAEGGLEPMLTRMAYGSMVGKAFTVNGLLCSLLAVVAAVLVQMFIEPKRGAVMGAGASAGVFALAGYWLVKSVFGTVSQTLQVCYLESPEKMREYAPELSESLGQWRF